MLVRLYLHSSSLEKSIKFYVEELALFKISENYGTGYCLLESTILSGFGIYLADSCSPTGGQNLFSLDVDDCDAQFRRLRAASFSSGARISPDEHGNIGVLEYPGGKVFQMEDPDKNAFTIYEHYKGDDDIAQSAS